MNTTETIWTESTLLVVCWSLAYMVQQFQDATLGIHVLSIVAFIGHHVEFSRFRLLAGDYVNIVVQNNSASCIL